MKTLFQKTASQANPDLLGVDCRSTRGEISLHPGADQADHGASGAFSVVGSEGDGESI